jgi:ATP-binding cassette subfamily F protein 3
VACFTNLTHAYGERILFLGANLEVERGDHIALVGPNGAGKSTLLRLLMGLEAPLEGQAALGEHNVIPAYFEQNQAEALDLSKEVLAMVFEVVPDWSQSQVRSYLGRFGFSNDDVFKDAGMLSGGEKARLALALLLLSPSNLLLLDEPTNHLDIPAKRMLEEAVMGYEGAAVLVSHDRAFVSKVANRIVELRDGELVLYRGDYAYYLEKKKEEALERERLRQEKERQAKREANRQRQRSRASMQDR